MLIQEYQEKWAKDFKEIKQVINEVLLGMNVSIEHIGSTSVLQLAAKPIIDIDVIYEPNVDFKELKKALEKIGYFYNGNQGIQEREVFKRQLLTQKHKVLDFITHHLYVCPIHSKELRGHLLFRNFLIENENSRLEYEQIKLQIAQEANQDHKKYAQLKEIKAKSFIQSIIERAKEK
ncbi:GrpB family protein [Rhodocytophaga aerolata]|uniref:GrpB family protein n=1 Tax=Rhodocytophaga aerolata TaxID=455078 RepID=A0ABT8RKF4_9BACT|nr:GrpB family protein [Rhodocytophaga aerolata]MDO1451362.1 GrpB family protein [Rhodocytophaga aerolata]